MDEATVAIENIHTHLGQGVPHAKAVLDASREVVIPRLLAMLCVLSGICPVILHDRHRQESFVPLSLSVGFAMAASYFLSSSLVPVMSTWILREPAHPEGEGKSRMADWRDRLGRVLGKLMGHRKMVLAVYLGITFAVILLLGPLMGREIFPRVNAGQFQLRFRAPIGTRVGATEIMALRVLDEIHQVAGANNVAVTLGYVGTQPPAYPINTIFLWTSGPQEAVLRVALNPDASISVAHLEQQLREKLHWHVPGKRVLF